MARYDAILSYLEHTKKYSAAQAAGILGNMQVESNFSPTAYNPGEHAIGLCQWEGGRRTGLQNWAQNHGGKETDLVIQLQYLSHELANNFAHVDTAIRKMRDPAQVAAEFDAHYEISSGEARTARENYARAIYKAISTAPTKPTTGTRYYVVKRGDTLWNIARRYYGNGALWTKIASANHLAHPNLIYPGMRLVIP